MKPENFSSHAAYIAATQTQEGAAFPLSMPLSYYEAGNAVASAVAPWVSDMASASTNLFAVLYQQDMSLNLQPGLYAKVTNIWELAIPYQYIDTYVLNGGTSTLYINITKTEIPPIGAEVFHNGVLDQVGTIPTGIGIWAALFINSSYVLPEATTTTLGGIKVGAGLTANAGVLNANVLSVAGRTGTIALAVGDINGAAPEANPRFSGYPIVQTGQTTYKLQVAQEIDTYQHPGPTVLDHTAVYLQLGGTEAGQNDYRMIGLGYVYNGSLTDVPPAMMGFQTTSQVGDFDNTYGDLIFATRNTGGKNDKPTIKLRIDANGKVTTTVNQVAQNYGMAPQELVTKAYLDANMVNLANIEGTASQVNVTRDAGGKIVLSTPQNIDTNAIMTLQRVITTGDIDAGGAVTAKGTSTFTGYTDVNSGIVHIQGTGQGGWVSLLISDTTADASIMMQNNTGKKFISLSANDLVFFNGGHSEIARLKDKGAITVSQDQTAYGYIVDDQELVTKKYVAQQGINNWYVNLFGKSDVWNQAYDFWLEEMFCFDSYIPENFGDFNLTAYTVAAGWVCTMYVYLMDVNDYTAYGKTPVGTIVLTSVGSGGVPHMVPTCPRTLVKRGQRLIFTNNKNGSTDNNHFGSIVAKFPMERA